MKNKGIIGQFENRKSIDFNLILITILIKLNDLIMILIKLNDFNHDFNHFHIPFSSFLFYFFIRTKKKKKKIENIQIRKKKKKKFPNQGRKVMIPLRHRIRSSFFHFFHFFHFIILLLHNSAAGFFLPHGEKNDAIRKFHDFNHDCNHDFGKRE